MNTELTLLPQPRSLSYSNGIHLLHAGCRIVFDGGAAPELLSAVQRLQRALGALAGGALPLSAFDTGDASVLVLICVVPERVAQPQGYELAITPERIEIAAHDPAGAF